MNLNNRETRTIAGLIVAIVLACIAIGFILTLPVEPDIVVSVNGTIAVVEQQGGHRLMVKNPFPELKVGDHVQIEYGYHSDDAIVRILDK